MSTRIAVCFPFTGDTIGGSHISALGLIAGLNRNRFRVIVVPQHGDGAIAALFRDRGIPVEPLSSRVRFAAASRIGGAALLRSLANIPARVAFLRRNRVDIVHTNDGGTHATWALPARIAGAKLLWHHRGDPEARGLRLAAPLLASRVVSVSRFALPAPGRYSAARRAEVLHSPFDTSIIEDRAIARAALLTELGLGDDAICIGFVGAFVARKRPLLFVEAIAGLRDLVPERPVHGVMFGEAVDACADADLDRHLGASGLRTRVHRLGWRTPGTRWIAACDQLLVPASGEPFGRTLVEAMLVGTPVVATRSGGNAEALRDGRLGVLVPPEDAGALAAASASLIREPATAAAFAHAAQADARDRFGTRAHVARVENIYEELADGRAVRPAAARSRDADKRAAT